jgi:hypothetical protein
MGAGGKQFRDDAPESAALHCEERSTSDLGTYAFCMSKKNVCSQALAPLALLERHHEQWVHGATGLSERRLHVRVNVSLRRSVSSREQFR